MSTPVFVTQRPEPEHHYQRDDAKSFMRILSRSPSGAEPVGDPDVD
jgi:hypothetical protein